MRGILSACLVAAWVLACGSGGATGADVTDTGTDIDVVAADPGPAPDVAPDAVDDSVRPDVPVTDETPADVPEADVLPTDPGPVGTDVVGDFGPDIPDVVQPFPPRHLPFEYTRTAEGEPVAAADVTAFTKKVTGLWKRIDWFRWVLRTNFGVDASTGKADFLAWHGDFSAEKTGGVVAFHENGGDDNMWIPGSVVLSSAMAGYLLTGDWAMGKVAEQFCKGLTATVKGFVWDANDPAPNLMARAIFPMDHDFTMDAVAWKDDGRAKSVTFHDDWHESSGWNASTVHFPTNPTWGDIWVRNMRSTDDVRAITRMTTFLPYLVADAGDDWVKSACQETLTTMKAFNKDIVDSGWNIRTKGADGVAYIIPCTGGPNPQDLGSYVCYIDIDPTDECCSRVTSDFIAYGEKRTPEDCNACIGSIFDQFSAAAHYYNYPILWDYHMAAVGNALVYQQNALAWSYLDGLSKRVDSYVHPSADEPGASDPSWGKDIALLLVEAASVGLPLTWTEARMVQAHWAHAVTDYQDWPNWDLWAATVADGPVQVRPSGNNDGVDIENLTMLMEYCNSPFQNPAGVAFVDCDVVKDPTKWGQ